MSYLVRDFIYAGVLTYLALQIHLIPHQSLRVAAWLLYGFMQGCVGTGLWILAHECGHGSFSKYSKLNNVVGWFVHSLLLVPYYSWKITHARHHRYHSHMEKDVVFVPWTAQALAEKRKTTLQELIHASEETPAITALRLLAHQIGGWQVYLLFNVSAGRKSIPEGTGRQNFKTASHFDPSGALFLRHQWLSIFLTDVGLLLTASFLYWAGTHLGASNIFLLYFVPYFWVHHWLIAITYLHHTHPSVPHYAEGAWTFTKGALCTIDRNFGFIGRHFFHEIIDYHVIHHLFPKIPFYHAEEATMAVKPLLGNQYRDNKSESFTKSLYTTFKSCNFVSERPAHAPDSKPGVLYWVGSE